VVVAISFLKVVYTCLGYLPWGEYSTIHLKFIACGVSKCVAAKQVKNSIGVQEFARHGNNKKAYSSNEM